jgi:Domain of unknown function (DUF4260)
MYPRPLLHLEGASVLTASLVAYHWSHGSWLQFTLLFLVPDLAMLGYLAGVHVGAITYNAVHTYVGLIVLAAYSFGSNRLAIFSLSLIWIAHIGLDRMLGFGLKYPSRFKDTHLNPDRHSPQMGTATYRSRGMREWARQGTLADWLTAHALDTIPRRKENGNGE